MKELPPDHVMASGSYPVVFYYALLDVESPISQILTNRN